MIVLKATQDKVPGPLQSVAGIVERRHTLADPGQRADPQDRRRDRSSRPATSRSRSAPRAELGGDARQLRDHGRRAQADRHPALACRATRRARCQSSQNKLTLKGGKSRFTLQTLPAEDFPLVQEAADFGPVFSVPQKTLKDLLNQVHFAMAVHDIRYYLNGILFVAEGKQLTLVATDGHRLALRQRDARRRSARAGSDPAAQDRARAAAPAVRRRRARSRCSSPATRPSSRFGGMEFVTKLVEGKFPDYNRVIPKNHKNASRSAARRCWRACSAPRS